MRLSRDYLALAVGLAREAFGNTAIVRDMRTTARELGITPRVEETLRCGCPKCPACARRLAEGLAELYGPRPSGPEDEDGDV